MLNLEQIAARIVQPELCQREELLSLKELTDKYPYAQLFSILHLKALSIHNDIHFEDELANHAYRITDRAQLFDLIHFSSTDVVVERDEKKEREIEEREIEESVGTEESDVGLKNQEGNVQFDRDLLSQALVSGYLPEEGLVPNEDRSFEEESTEKGEDPSTISGNRETEEERILRPVQPFDKLSGVQAHGDQAQEEEVAQRSFTSWLRSNANEIPQIDVDKARIDDLVNQFINKEPSITRPSKDGQEAQKPKTEFYSAAKKAKESLDMGSMPVSETLAKIFALQGNYPKAIYAYEQLILSNPEKKIFFASRIEELQKKLNT